MNKNNNNSGTKRNGTERNGTERNGTERGKNNNSNEISSPFKVFAKSENAEQSLRLSILICTYNRANTLKGCLENMATITADKSLYEIVVINNNSTDHTNEICQDFAEKHPEINFRLIVESKVGFYSARNRAISEAKSELLSFMDDDQTIQPNYVDVIIKTFEDYPEYAAVAGKMLVLGEDGIEPDFYSKYLNPFCKVDLGNVAHEYPRKLSLKNPTVYFPPGGTITFKKEVPEKYGNYGDAPFEGAGAEDIFFTNKLRKNNQKILYMPDILIHHHIPKERYEYNALMQMAYLRGSMQAKTQPNKQLNRILKFIFSALAGTFYFITLRPTKGRYLAAFQYNWVRGYIHGSHAAH